MTFYFRHSLSAVFIAVMNGQRRARQKDTGAHVRQPFLWGIPSVAPKLVAGISLHLTVRLRDYKTIIQASIFFFFFLWDFWVIKNF